MYIEMVGVEMNLFNENAMVTAEINSTARIHVCSRIQQLYESLPGGK